MHKASPVIKVLCVDDNPDIAMLMEMAVNAQADMQSAGCVHTAEQLQQHVKRTRPDIVVLDLSMPGKDPLEVVQQMGESCPETRVIMYSGYDDLASRDAAIDAGAWGFVSKHNDMDELVNAVRRVAKGELAITEH
jgi:DNA-binding NarL/FixJ family response regulator